MTKMKDTRIITAKLRFQLEVDKELFENVVYHLLETEASREDIQAIQEKVIQIRKYLEEGEVPLH